MKIDVMYEIDDGYAGQSRPHHVSFDPEDYLDDDETWESIGEDKRQEIAQEIVEEDFQDRIHPYIKRISAR